MTGKNFRWGSLLNNFALLQLKDHSDRAVVCTEWVTEDYTYHSGIWPLHISNPDIFYS